MLHVDVSYGYKLPLGSLARDFKPGMYGFAGPNGSGKSTLLLTIAGGWLPSQGRWCVLGSGR